MFSDFRRLPERIVSSKKRRKAAELFKFPVPQCLQKQNELLFKAVVRQLCGQFFDHEDFHVNGIECENGASRFLRIQIGGKRAPNPLSTLALVPAGAITEDRPRIF